MRKAGSIATLVRAGLLTGVSDGVFSSVVAVAFYHSTFGRLWRAVASVLLGPRALEGGRAPVLVGLVLHFCTAFWWSFFFLFVVRRLPFVRRILASRFGVFQVACLYGPFVWIAMSLLVIPILAHHAPAITARWWVQFFGHIPFVAIPIVSRGGAALDDSEAAG